MVFSKRIKIITLFSLLLFSGCNRVSENENVFLNKTPRVVTFERIIDLKGKSIEINEIGLRRFSILDSLMIFMTPQLGTLYSVFHFNNYEVKHLSNLVTRGQGPNEFTHALHPRFFVREENQLLVAFYDFARQRIKYLNLTLSLLEERTVFDNKTTDLQNIDGFVSNVVPLNCNFLFIHRLDEVNLNYHYSIFDIGKEQIIEDNLVIVPNLRGEANWLVGATNTFNKGKKMYVGAMRFLDQINFYNIAYPDQSFTITTNRNRRSRNLSAVEGTPMPEKIEYYVEFRSTDSHLFGLYANMNRRDWAIGDKPAVIHVFDWEGNPVVKLRTTEKITTFDIDPINNRLYGLTEYEELFVYDLNGIL